MGKKFKVSFKKKSLCNIIITISFVITISFHYESFVCVRAEEIEFVASTPNLQVCAKYEQKLLSVLYNYTEHLELHITKLKGYIEDFQHLFSGSEINDLKNCKKLTFYNFLPLNPDESGDPWAVYKNLVDLQRLTEDAEHRNLEDELGSFLQPTFLPKFRDRVESILSLLSLISVYELEASDLSKGKLVNTETKSGLSPSLLFEIGQYARESKMYNVAVDFLHEAFVSFSSYLNSTARSESKELSTLKEKLVEAISLHDENFETGGSSKNFYSEQLVDMEHLSFINRKRPHAEVLPVTQEQEDVYSNPQMFRNFEILCKSGYSEPILEKKSDLKCFLYSKIHPYWLLSPLKLEILHKSPLIFQVYNVLTDTQVNFLIREAEPNLQRSRVFGNDSMADALGETNVTTVHRTSSNAWLDDREENSKHGYVNILAQLITGLSTRKPTSTELLQLANYATGGAYIPHVDAFFYDEILQYLNPQDMSMGDRIGTFMIYLNDVDQGGCTAFPLLGVVAKPIKGSAVFWLNLHPDGTINSQTLHGGCSVLQGTKYIANKWIRRHDQMFIMKCPKDYENNSDLKEHRNYYYQNFYEFED